METEEPAKSVEVTSGVQPTKPHVLQSPRKKAVPSESPGVLQLGKLLPEKAVEVEAVRILVPRAAMTRDVPKKPAKAGSPGRRKGEFLGQPEAVAGPRGDPSEMRNSLDKLRDSERRLLQDREGLSNQLRVQTEVRAAVTALLGRPHLAPSEPLCPWSAIHCSLSFAKKFPLKLFVLSQCL